MRPIVVCDAIPAAWTGSNQIAGRFGICIGRNDFGIENKSSTVRLCDPYNILLLCGFRRHFDIGDGVLAIHDGHIFCIVHFAMFATHSTLRQDVVRFLQSVATRMFVADDIEQCKLLRIYFEVEISAGSFVSAPPLRSEQFDSVVLYVWAIRRHGIASLRAR